MFILGDSIHELPGLPAESVDLVFADPPYYLQLKKDLWRPNNTQVDAVNDEWDKFEDYAAYDAFTRNWLEAVRRVMKSDATIWVSGTYHNIFRVGTIMQDMGFWILNTVVWYRHNAMPNFRGTRLKNDVEFVIWAKYSEDSRYTFHHHLMKRFNDFSPGKQLGSVWQINTCGGPERLRDEQGNRLHPTQKPEDLLHRIILASSKPGDLVLDPFAGTGTTAVVAKRLRRNYISIEQDEIYYRAAQERLRHITQLPESHELIRAAASEKLPRVAFKKLLKQGYVQVGQTLYLDDPQCEAVITKNGKLCMNGQTESIHKLACILKDVRSTNGWVHWHYLDEQGTRRPIDELRHQFRLDTRYNG